VRGGADRETIKIEDILRPAHFVPPTITVAEMFTLGPPLQRVKSIRNVRFSARGNGSIMSERFLRGSKTQVGTPLAFTGWQNKERWRAQSTKVAKSDGE